VDRGVTAVVISYSDPQSTAEAVRSLVDQSLAPVEVLVVDNDEHGAASRSERIQAQARVLAPGGNLGYTGAANLAAREARGEWLFFLNPDALAESDCLARLMEAVDGPDVVIVGAQVLLPDGRVNAGDNPINIAGISWSGHYGQPREHAPARDTAAVSGAALLVRRDRFLGLGGLCPYFFLYVDDTDLAWRVRLAGGRVRFCPEAVVVHDYAFDKGSGKWFYLERNRMWALLSNLQLRTLALLAPVLLATEAAVFARSVREGWLREKLRAWGFVIGHGPELSRWRGAVQRHRRVSDDQVLRLFVGGVETSLLEAGPPRWGNLVLERYRRVVLRLLRSPEH
jgi:GT2 family glycosyltransferase